MVRVSGGLAADVSDRAARLLGVVSQNDSAAGPTDAEANAASAPLGSDGGPLRHWTRNYVLNGTTWDRLRNLQAGNPKFHLGIGNDELAAAYGGNSYAAAAISLIPAAAGNAIRQRLINPAASGKNVVVHRIGMGGNVNRLGGVIITSPALAALTNAITIGNKRAGGAAGVATASYALNTPATSGTRIISLQTASGGWGRWEGRLFLPVNSSLDINFDDPGNAVTDVYTAFIEWYEET